MGTLTTDKIRAIHQEQSRSVCDAFKAWIEKTSPHVKSESKLAYVMKRQLELKVYLSDPDVPMDTNHLVRALRVFPMGRSNLLFVWTELDTEHIGVIQSLLVTSKLHVVPRACKSEIFVLHGKINDLLSVMQKAAAYSQSADENRRL